MQANGLTTNLAGGAVRSEAMGALTALLFGAFVVFVVGFAGASVLHEAAHDTRHSIAFPCH